MNHYQQTELVNYLLPFLGGIDTGYVVVEDPESKRRVDFLYRDPGKPFMRLILHDPNELEVAAAQRLGLPVPERRQYREQYGSNRGNVVTQLWYWLPVHEAAKAAELCLRIMQDIHNADPKKWLWITDIYEPDEWPDPLPRPASWPPV